MKGQAISSDSIWKQFGVGIMKEFAKGHTIRLQHCWPLFSKLASISVRLISHFTYHRPGQMMGQRMGKFWSVGGRREKSKAGRGGLARAALWEGHQELGWLDRDAGLQDGVLGPWKVKANKRPASPTGSDFINHWLPCLRETGDGNNQGDPSF